MSQILPVKPFGQHSFLIVGLGSIGRRHLRNLASLGYHDIRLLRTGRSTIAEAELAGYEVEHDLDRALKLRPTAVIIANPTSAHIPVALKAARAGCHLFLEKPISDTIDGLAELRELQNKNRLVIMTGFQFRFHPALQQIKVWLDEKRLGPLVSVHVHWGEYLPDWHPWENYRQSYAARRDMGGGVVLTLCHPFDYLRWLVGDIETVFAKLVSRSGLEIDTEDAAAIVLQFVDGTIGMVYLDYVQKPVDHSLTIIGQKGTLRWENLTGTAQLYTADTAERSEFKPPAGFDRNIMFLQEMIHFINAIEKEAQPDCTLEDGLRTLEIALAVHASAQTKREINASSI